MLSGVNVLTRLRPLYKKMQLVLIIGIDNQRFIMYDNSGVIYTNPRLSWASGVFVMQRSRVRVKATRVYQQ